MATTGKVRSNSLGVYISTSQGGSTLEGDTIGTLGSTGVGNTFGDTSAEAQTFQLIAAATSGSFSGSRDVIDATTKDNDGRREILIAGSQWSMSADGLIQYDLGGTVENAISLFDLWNGATKVRLAWTTAQDGDYIYYGDAFITSYEESAGLNEVATFSVSFEGDGAITKALVDTANLTFNDNND